MSASGIPIQIPERAPAGTKIEIVMDWTGLYHNREAMRLHLIAAVTRADSAGIALRILRHRFQEAYPEIVRRRGTERKRAVA